MSKMTLNQLFHAAKDRSLTSEYEARFSVVTWCNPAVGVEVKALIKYDLSEGKYAGRPYAYGAQVLFPQMGEAEYDRIANRAISRHGRSREAEREVALTLLSRDDATATFYDEEIMNLPAMKMETGELDLKAYRGSGDLGPIKADLIEKSLVDSTSCWIDHGPDEAFEPWPAPSRDADSDGMEP